MSNIRVRTSTSNVSVRVGQENAIRVLSSAAGGGQFAETSNNVIGGIASVTSLNVSGISTLYSLSLTDTLEVTGSSIFYNEVTIDSNLNTSQLNVAGLISYSPGALNGVVYVDNSGDLRTTESYDVPSVSETNVILTTNEFGVPAFSNSIDGGTY